VNANLCVRLTAESAYRGSNISGQCVIRRPVLSMTALMIVVLLGMISQAESQNLLSSPESVAFDSLRNRYLVSNYSNGIIVAIDSQGNQSWFATDLTSAVGLHIVGDTLWAACAGGRRPLGKGPASWYAIPERHCL
jgi:hypothetical protein